MNAVGQANPFSDASEYNTLDFVIARATEKMQTVTIVKVMAVDTGAQTVDALVLVNLVSGAGVSIPHGVIAARPYVRAQGGSSGIILDPAVGDIGVMVFGSRDLTGVISAKGAANPGSNRRFSWSDGIYFGGLLNSTPTQYLQFLSSGITLLSPTAIKLQSPANKVQGPLDVTGATTLEATLHLVGNGQFDGTLNVNGEISSGTEVTAPLGVFGSLTVGSSISLPAGSISSADLASTGVTAGSYTNTNLTVNSKGQITAASNGSSSGAPLTTKGDLFGFTTTDARIPVGANGKVLTADSTAAAGVSWQTPTAGAAEPFNVTPDTHDAVPTGVGVGPNDYFEYGSTLDTTGARYAGATPWTKVLTNTETYAVSAGALLVTDTGQSDLLITQPISGTAWKFRAKINFYGTGGGSNATHVELMARDSATGKQCGGGLIINPSYSPYTWMPYWSTDATFNNYTALNGPLNSYPGIWDTGYNKFAPTYVELELSSASVIFRISNTGYEGSFIQQGTLALSANGQSVVDTIGIRLHTNTGLNAAIDSFLRIA